MGQEAGEKWTAAVDLQPTIPKSDRLLRCDGTPLLDMGQWNQVSVSTTSLITNFHLLFFS